MNIRIEPFKDYTDHTIFNTLASWDNDPEIRSLILPGINEGDIARVTGDELMYFAHEHRTRHIYLVYDEDLLIGSYSIDTNFEERICQEPQVAWISVVIGDKNYWGKGIGRFMMEDLEERCLELGCSAIELGVFDYNERAIELYQSMGYVVLDTIDNFVFHDGRWHKDIRMLKTLT